MAFTQQQLEAIETIIAKGIKSVEYDGRTVTYQNADHLLAVLASMVEQVPLTEEAGGIGQTVFATFTRE